MIQPDEGITPQNELETARSDVMAAEKEISKIKLALRALSTPYSTSSNESGDTKNDDDHESDKEENFLKISASKISRLPEESEPIIEIQLSSPIESQTLTSFLEGEAEDKEGAIAIFRGVDTDVATIVLKVSDKGNLLGVSAPHPVKPLTEIDFLSGCVKRKVTEFEIAVVSEQEEGGVERGDVNSQVAGNQESSDDDVYVDALSKEDEDTVNEKILEEEKSCDKEEPSKKNDDEELIASPLINTEDQQKEEEKEVTKPPPTSTGKGGKIELPTCVVYVRVAFIPSKNDEKNELCDLLNRMSKKKALAIQKLRKAAETMNRSRASEVSSIVSRKGNDGSTAVKAGFLNKKSKVKTKEPMAIVRWYEKVLGPESVVRKFFPVAKNYLLFFGGVVLMHYQGHQLALPAPV